MDFRWATPTPDGSGIVAIGASEHAELVRYDSTIGQFVRYLGDANNSGGLDALELDFSRDGSRLVYSIWPERTLWAMNAAQCDAQVL